MVTTYWSTQFFCIFFLLAEYLNNMDDYENLVDFFLLRLFFASSFRPHFVDFSHMRPKKSHIFAYIYIFWTACACDCPNFALCEFFRKCMETLAIIETRKYFLP